MEFNMCNVIILLNKPLEEDIPFTTSTKAGSYSGAILCSHSIRQFATEKYIQQFCFVKFMHFTLGKVKVIPGMVKYGMFKCM